MRDTTPEFARLVEGRFARMAPEPELQRRILVENPARLYGF